ncbi:MAG: response regulator [Opitutales bacterium]
MVLVADDDENSAAFMTAVVRKLGYQPIWVTDGQVAFERAKTAKPAVIMMDLMMPGFDGLTSIRLLRVSNATQQIPIVVVSGLDAASHAEKCREAGAAAFLAKPLTADQVRAVLRDLHLGGA